MIQQLKISGRFNLSILLMTMSGFCFIISLLRFYFSESRVFLFLNWNLFLAFIPWMISSVLILNKQLRENKLALSVLIFTWLAFFPNAPYILTDLFHLKQRGSVPIWFDLVVVLSFAWTGLIYGFLSLMDIEKLISKYLPGKMLRSSMIVLLFIGSFGVYIGRYLRWNSWDFLKDPVALFMDIGDRFINPFSHPRTWGMTILLGILLNMMYWTFKVMSSHEKKGSITV